MKLPIHPLSKDSFKPYGEVIEIEGSAHFPINQGTTERFHNLANLDLNVVGGKPIVSIFESQPRPLPIKLEVMERHPLGSQAFYPLQNQNWLIVVASGLNPTNFNNLKAFRAKGTQGVNYARNTWHHPLLVLEPNSRFLIIDRDGPGKNLEEIEFTENVFLACDAVI